MISLKEQDLKNWEESCLKPSLKKASLRKKEFKTRTAGIPAKPIYTPLDVKDRYLEKIGFPGQYPYTRGVYPTMYRSRLWTIRQYSGYGTPQETNEIFKNLLEWGETGLSLAFDLPSQCGYDSDHPMAKGEVGRVGVSINTLRDMERIFDGIPLHRVSTSMTINATAPIMLAMYIATGEKRGVSKDKLMGTVQNDVLKEAVARNAWMLALEPSMKLSVDIIEYCTKYMPRFNHISVSEAHFREAGANPITSAAFTIADALEYIRWSVDRGLKIDEFAPRISFMFYAYTDVFEEAARLRALRRLWARLLKDRFEAKNPRSWMFRFAICAGGSSFAKRTPLLNLVRGTLGLLGSILGGGQTIWMSGIDEGYEIPTPEALKLAVRTAQVIAEETSIPDVVDPLAGSYYVEWLTDEMEERMTEKIEEIEEMGGALEAIRKGYYSKELMREAFECHKKIQNGEIPIIGENKYVEEAEKAEIQIYETRLDREKNALESLEEARRSRNPEKVDGALKALGDVAGREENLMPYIIDAVKAYATVGEICNVLREVYGEFEQIVVL